MSPSTDTRESREFAAEVKFLMTHGVADQVRDWARGRLVAGPNASGPSGDGYRINSLYFDTERFDVFHRNGSFGRSKYRIRKYGESKVAFLERKLKTRGLVTKRRTLIRLEELDKVAEPSVERSWPGCWFQRRLEARDLGCVCQISYHRTARVAMTDYGPIRLTLDDDLLALPRHRPIFETNDPGVRFLEGQVILELKFLFSMPTTFKRLIEEFALNARSISKYRIAAAALGLVSECEAPIEDGIPGPGVEDRISFDADSVFNRNNESISLA